MSPAGCWSKTLSSNPDILFILFVVVRFVGYQSVNEATSAIQKFDGFVFEQEGLRLKVSLAKPRSEFRDLRYSDRESSEESSSSVKKPKGIVEMRNGARNEASDSNIDIRCVHAGGKQTAISA